jgi:hypothetical protein
MMMATRAAAIRPIASERQFFTGMAIAMLVFTFIGFAPTYFLTDLLGAANPRGNAALTPLVHVHAVVSSAWMILLVAQTSLIAGRRTDLHRIAGIFGVLLAVVVIIVGVMTALESARMGRTPPGRSADAFLVYPMASVFLLALFATLGFALRRQAQHHKRLMLLATIAMLVPAGARMTRQLFAGILPVGPVGGMLLSNIFLVALVIHDLRRDGRLHPVTVWGGGFLLASEPLRVILSDTPAWRSFAAMLIGSFQPGYVQP